MAKAFERADGKIVVTYAPRGAIRDAFTCKKPELILSGPAGTGKTRGALEKVHLCLIKYPNSRWLMARKTRMSMTETCMWVFEKEVLHRADKVRWAAQEQRYEYPNGSTLVVAGLDKSEKVFSSQYDGAYVNEATEITVKEWEDISTRLRNGVMPYQQMLGDCNPSWPKHWIMQRAKTGALTIFNSHHTDNPVLWDKVKQDFTDRGRRYMDRLDALTGIRRLRLRDGIWAAAEGVIYDEWNPDVHLIPYHPIPEGWPRYWCFDFGYTNPFVWQAWAEDPDGRLIRYREIYMTRRLVEDHAGFIEKLTEGEPKPRAIVCDHDAEGRATLERHMEVRTLPAYKDVAEGVQAVKNRLKVQPDGRPRILFMRDALAEVDRALMDAAEPLCTEDEFPCYTWDEKALSRGAGDVPIDKWDHGMDATRYMVAFADNLAIDPDDAVGMAVLGDESMVRISPF